MAFPINRRFFGYDEVRSVAHGLTASSVGKPIGWDSTGKPVVWQDHSSPQNCDPVAILYAVIDADTIKISTTGSVAEVANSLLPGSMPVNGGQTNSRWLFWDQSAGAYVHTKPSDSVIATESIYWIGASATSGYSICLAAHPNRPATIAGGGGGTGFTTNTPYLFQVWGNKTGTNITPTNASPLTIDPIGWNLQPSTADLSQMGLSTNVGKDRLTNISGASAYYLVRWNCNYDVTTLTGTSNLQFRFRHYNSSNVLQNTLGTINLDLSGSIPILEANAARQNICLLAANDYIKGDLLVTPSAGASFTAMDYILEMTVSKFFTDRAS